MWYIYCLLVYPRGYLRFARDPQLTSSKATCFYFVHGNKTREAKSNGSSSSWDQPVQFAIRTELLYLRGMLPVRKTTAAVMVSVSQFVRRPSVGWTLYFLLNSWTFPSVTYCRYITDEQTRRTKEMWTSPVFSRYCRCKRSYIMFE